MVEDTGIGIQAGSAESHFNALSSMKAKVIGNTVARGQAGDQ